MAQYIGRVRQFNNTEGHGTLRYFGGPDILVHYTALVGTRTLDAEDVIEFDIIAGTKGPQADHVARVAQNPAAVARLEMKPGLASAVVEAFG
jgi:CspA family cold shock protein